MNNMFFTLLYTLDSHAIILGDVFYLNEIKLDKLEEWSENKLVDRYCLL